MSLALASQIPFSVWLAEPEEAVLTAFELLDEQHEKMQESHRAR